MKAPLAETCVAVVNGHHIHRDDSDGLHFLWTPSEGYWGFYIKDEASARRSCEIVAPSKTSHQCAPPTSFHVVQPGGG
jgi:hypothetical protein